LYSKLYQREGNYKTALEYLQSKFRIDSSLLNEDNSQRIAEIQEKYNIQKKVNENRLLSAELDKQKLQKRNLTILAIAFLIIIGLIAAAWLINRNVNKKLRVTNNYVQEQNEKLAALNYEKNSLISIVSHDLSSPFTSIRMWSQVLEHGADNLTEDQKKAINRILTSTQNGEQLIRTILDIEKADHMQQPVSLHWFDVKELIEDELFTYGQVAAQKNITIQLEGPRVILLTDRNMLRRICSNLFSNALKFTPAGKSININISDQANWVSIVVKDEGVGIAAKDIPQLFSKYSVIASRPTNGETSTGLGLFIVRRLVEELNGEVHCESEEGNGTTFTVSMRK
jgi:signal transduction histidine kinase